MSTRRGFPEPLPPEKGQGLSLIHIYLDNSGFNVESLCASQNMSRSSFYNKLKALTDQALSLIHILFQFRS